MSKPSTDIERLCLDKFVSLSSYRESEHLETVASIEFMPCAATPFGILDRWTSSLGYHKDAQLLRRNECEMELLVFNHRIPKYEFLSKVK